MPPAASEVHVEHALRTIDEAGCSVPAVRRRRHPSSCARLSATCPHSRVAWPHLARLLPGGRSGAFKKLMRQLVGWQAMKRMPST